MRKRRDLGQPSDIAFLLIIFFLLLAGITATQSFDLSLLNTTNTQDLAEKNITITMNKDGALILAGQPLQRSELLRTLHSKTHLKLIIAEATQWQNVVDLLAVLETHPVASLSLEVSE